MDDRELLELAAKAAGIEGNYSDGVIWYKNPFGDCAGFNPLKSNGDALSLAVKLKMNIFHAANKCYAMDYEGDFESIVSHASDPYAATRRAIVRAAAEIGRAI